MALLPISNGASGGAARGCCAGVNIGIAMGQSGDCVTDAPSDGKIHGRKDGGWVDIPDGAVVDSLAGGAADEAPSVRAVNEALGGKASQADISQAVAQIHIPTVANTLTSTSTTDALSAAMGKELKAQVDRKVELPAGDIVLIVDGTNGNDATATGTEARPYKTIEAAYNALPGVASRTCTIRIKAGTYVLPSIDVKKGLGGIVSFEAFSNTRDVTWETTSGAHAVICNSVPIILKTVNIKFKASSTSGGMTNNGIVVIRSGSAIIMGCELDGFLQYGVYSGAMGFTKIENCQFKNIGTAAISIDIGILLSLNNTSDNSARYGLNAVSSIIYKSGTQPTGTVANEQKTNGGQIFG